MNTWSLFLAISRASVASFVFVIAASAQPCAPPIGLLTYNDGDRAHHRTSAAMINERAGSRSTVAGEQVIPPGAQAAPIMPPSAGEFGGTKATILKSVTAEPLRTSQYRESLGADRIKQITCETFIQYLKEREDGPHIKIDQTFWPELYERIGRLAGPEENPEAFLARGFKAFLPHYETYLRRERHDPVVFSAATVKRYVKTADCDGSPCDIPPCCGDGDRCWKCD